MIYFARTDQYEHPEIDYIKIGYTSGDDAKRRINQLQTASPFAIKLIGTIAGADTRHENVLHSVFSDDRINGEWFRASARLIAYIESFATTYGEIEPPRFSDDGFDALMDELSDGDSDEFVYITLTAMYLSALPSWRKALFHKQTFNRATAAAHRAIVTLQSTGYLNISQKTLKRLSDYVAVNS